MGVGTSNVLDRVAASMGDLVAVEPVFQAVWDIPNGGVLFALPALLAVGLLHQAHKYFQLPKGYYGLESLFLMLGFLALARLPSLEQLRYCAPANGGSAQQGRESSGVKVPMPSVARFGRLAYPLLGEVTNRDMRGRKSHGCPVCCGKGALW